MLTRSALFVPGNIPRMMINADTFGADLLIIDLEDAISPAQKDSARILTKHYLESAGPFRSTVAVRINHFSTPYFKEDIEQMVPLKILLMTPKIDTAADILRIDKEIAAAEERCGMEKGSTGLLVILESALGMQNAYEIASSSKRVVAICIGAEDLAVDLQAKRTKGGREILYSRQRMLLAARAAGVLAIDTVCTDIDDIDSMLEDARFTKELGYDGKSSITPQHIRHINEIFSPTSAEIAHAKEVVLVMEEGFKAGKGAVALHGKMIDLPVYERAKQTIANAREMGKLEERGV